MVIKFTCKKCEHKIAVKHLKHGEEAVCFNCGEINVIPDNADYADDIPDYIKYKSQNKPKNKIYNSKKNIFKPSKKQIFFSSLVGALFALVNKKLGDSDSIIECISIFLVGFIMSYISNHISTISYNEEKEINKFIHSTAPQDGRCRNCSKPVKKGELIHIKKDFLARLFNEEIILCINCYNDYKLSVIQPPKRKKK